MIVGTQEKQQMFCVATHQAAVMQLKNACSNFVVVLSAGVVMWR